jgi:hypothetical protein
MLTAELARSLWTVDEEGFLRGVSDGEIACKVEPTGYRTVRCKPLKRRFGAHRVVFLIVNGYMPVWVDHRNRTKADNRPDNLRASDPQRNAFNRARSRTSNTPFKGITLTARGWWAVAQAGYVRIPQGPFVTPEEAARAYDELARQHHGEFACTNEDLGLLPPLAVAA